MLRKAAARVAWVGRTASMVMGLALVMALVLGVGTMALAAVPGDPFELGETNTINNALTKLAGSNAGTMLMVDNNSSASGARALDLRVEPGKQPLNVNADAGKAGNLNADEVDGLGADQIRVNGLEVVEETSILTDSTGVKSARADCPEGKALVGIGHDITGGQSLTGGAQETDVVITDAKVGVFFGSTPVAAQVQAFEEEPTSEDWFVEAIAICATANIS